MVGDSLVGWGLKIQGGADGANSKRDASGGELPLFFCFSEEKADWPRVQKAEKAMAKMKLRRAQI
jgi:hypothetical protein